MVLTTAPARARWAARVRLASLVAVALLVAHSAIYAAEDGLGGAFAAAMARDGHGAWWLVICGVVGAIGVAGATLTVARLARLERRARGRHRRRLESAFWPEARAIARRLLPATLLLFGIQENLEQLAAHGRIVGVDAVLAVHPLAVPVLLVVCLGLSLAGALVRWRIATLQRRIVDGPAPRRARAVAADAAADRWRTIGALAPRPWLLVRLDAGRSPPALASR